MQALGIAAGVAGGASPLGLGLAVAGTLISGITSFMGAQQQARQLTTLAARQVETGRQALEAGKRQAQDKDLEAAQILAANQATRAASGFDVNSVSFGRRASRNRFLVSRDRMRLVENAELEADRQFTGADESRASARSTRLGGILSLLGTGIDAYSTLVNDATFNNQLSARKIRRNSIRT